MALVKTTRLTKHDESYEIEIPKEFIEKMDWRDGHILEISETENKLVIEKLQGFVGS